MLILAIDTSTQVFSIAMSDGSHIIGEIYFNGKGKHSDILYQHLDWLLKQNQISLFDIKKIACTIGPGSFTGIRVGLTACRTLAQQLNIPLVGISTLDILAHQTIILPCNNILVCPIISALPEKVYTAVYRVKSGTSCKGKGSVKRLTSYQLKNVKNVKRPHFHFPIVFTGDAVSRWRKLIKKILGNINQELFFQTQFPKASTLAAMASRKKGNVFSRVKPLYINPPKIRQVTRVTR